MVVCGDLFKDRTASASKAMILPWLDEDGFSALQASRVFPDSQLQISPQKLECLFLSSVTVRRM